MGILWDVYNVVSEQNNTTVIKNEGIDDILKEVKEINQSKDRVDLSLKEYNSMREELTELREKLSKIDKNYWNTAKTLSRILGFPVIDIDLFTLEIVDATLDKDPMRLETNLIIKYKVEER